MIISNTIEEYFPNLNHFSNVMLPKCTNLLHYKQKEWKIISTGVFQNSSDDITSRKLNWTGYLQMNTSHWHGFQSTNKWGKKMMWNFLLKFWENVFVLKSFIGSPSTNWKTVSVWECVCLVKWTPTYYLYVKKVSEDLIEKENKEYAWQIYITEKKIEYCPWGINRSIKKLKFPFTLKTGIFSFKQHVDLLFYKHNTLLILWLYLHDSLKLLQTQCLHEPFPATWIIYEFHNCSQVNVHSVQLCQSN